jgi:hypothetical protein
MNTLQENYMLVKGLTKEARRELIELLLDIRDTNNEYGCTIATSLTLIVLLKLDANITLTIEEITSLAEFVRAIDTEESIYANTN